MAAVDDSTEESLQQAPIRAGFYDKQLAELFREFAVQEVERRASSDQQLDMVLYKEAILLVAKKLQQAQIEGRE